MTESAQLDLVSDQAERPVRAGAVPGTDQSRTRDNTGDPYPGVATPAGWFLRAAPMTMAHTPVSVSSSADRKPGEPRIETGPGIQAPQPGPADPIRPPLIPAPRRSPESDPTRTMSVWQHSYHLWTQSGIPWQQPVPARTASPAVSSAQSSPLERVDYADKHAASPAGRDSDHVGYTGRHARNKTPRRSETARGLVAAAAEPTPGLPGFAAAQFLGAPVQIATRPAARNGTLLAERPAAAPPLLPPPLPVEDDRDHPGLAPQRSRLLFGRRALALGVPVLVLAMVAATAVALLTGHGPNANRGQVAGRAQAAAPSEPMPGYPGLGTRGVFESASRIVVYRGTAPVPPPAA